MIQGVTMALTTPKVRDRIWKSLAADRQIWGPVSGTDGVIRLQALSQWTAEADGLLPLLPVKKFLLPPVDTLWEEVDGQARSAIPGGRLAVVGLTPCDLAAVGYLDQVFAEDAGYRRRRERLFLVGAPCRAENLCRCRPPTTPLPFDLFLQGESVYQNSSAGASCLTAAGVAAAAGPLPDEAWPATLPPLPSDLLSRFLASRAAPFWRETAARCLSCGACSVLCPTCYCYAVTDQVDAAGAAVRQRRWDNCFFPNHGLVAGGHNFRPTRTERLQFRFEHKLLGFGSLRGRSSCVDCGRCRKACPVGIDLTRLVEQLTAGGPR